MIDRPLLIKTLDLLNQQRDLAPGSEENELCNELNLLSNQPLTTGLVREHLTWCEERGWITRSRDSIGARRWKITEAGIKALPGLRQGM